MEEFLRFPRRADRRRSPARRDEALRDEQKRLRAASKLHSAASRGEEVLYSAEGRSSNGWLGCAVSCLNWATSTRTSARWPRSLAMLKACWKMSRTRCGATPIRCAPIPERLAEIDDRLHLLSRLLRKHGPDMAALLQKRAEMTEELARLQANEAHRSDAETEVTCAKRAAAEVAARLRWPVARERGGQARGRPPRRSRICRCRAPPSRSA